jgi:regulation of enolase protein 1 (concanavalin A-like superfamily)
VDDAVDIDGFPTGLCWLVPPERSQLDASGLTIAAGAKTDWFVDPAGDRPSLATGPVLLGSVDGDYQLRARVTVAFASAFDAGVLMLHVDDRTWAKLCFEWSPDGDPMVVSVVTDGVSDDANAFVVDGDDVWLRVSRLGRAIAFHASRDGAKWTLIRHFALRGEPRLGFEAQSPTGGGCTARFEQIQLSPTRLADLRDGS